MCPALECAAAPPAGSPGADDPRASRELDSSAGRRPTRAFGVSINADFDRPEVVPISCSFEQLQRARNNFLDWPQPAQSLITHDSIPSSGPINSTARDLSFATFSCVAACSHIFPFIAGATTIFARGLIASAMQLNASSAIPRESLADDIRRRWRDQQQVRLIGQADVRRFPPFLLVVQVGDYAIPRQRLGTGRSVMKRSASVVITT